MDFSQTWREFWSLLYSELDGKKKFPNSTPLLSHYTSLYNLENILKNEEIWLSNPLFMNDLEEVRFGVLTGFDLVITNDKLRSSLGDEERIDRFFDHFSQCYEDFANEQVIDLYIMCFSVHNADDGDGRLSMWRGYGQNGSGAALVFDTSKVTVIDDSPLALAAVQYATNQDRAALLRAKIEEVAIFLTANDIPLEYLHAVADALFKRICIFAVFSKHIGFYEEEEWRLVYLKDRDEKDKLKPYFSYFNGTEGIQPKLKLPTKAIPGVISEDFKFSDIIRSIIIGPTSSSPLARASLQRMLEAIGKPELVDRLYMSNIPFRGT